MRLFVGIPLEAKVVEELSAISMRLQSKADGLRWSALESWHITLQFLGNTTEYECIVTQLRQLREPQVPITLEGLGSFDRAGIFFAGVSLTPGLCGFIPETRPYHPHITLARTKAKNPKAMHELKAKLHREPKFSPFIAREFVLYESLTKPGGSEYQIRERFSLDTK
jgi:RNA 2',3'-cyclic 3'-phosphodiesterase